MSSVVEGCSQPQPGLYSLWARWMEGHGNAEAHSGAHSACGRDGGEESGSRFQKLPPLPEPSAVSNMQVISLGKIDLPVANLGPRVNHSSPGQDRDRCSLHGWTARGTHILQDQLMEKESQLSSPARSSQEETCSPVGRAETGK